MLARIQNARRPARTVLVALALLAAVAAWPIRLVGAIAAEPPDTSQATQASPANAEEPITADGGDASRRAWRTVAGGHEIAAGEAGGARRRAASARATYSGSLAASRDRTARPPWRPARRSLRALPRDGWRLRRRVRPGLRPPRSLRPPQRPSAAPTALREPSPPPPPLPPTPYASPAPPVPPTPPPPGFWRGASSVLLDGDSRVMVNAGAEEVALAERSRRGNEQVLVLRRGARSRVIHDRAAIDSLAALLEEQRRPRRTAGAYRERDGTPCLSSSNTYSSASSAGSTSRAARSRLGVRSRDRSPGGAAAPRGAGYLRSESVATVLTGSVFAPPVPRVLSRWLTVPVMLAKAASAEFPGCACSRTRRSGS